MNFEDLALNKSIRKALQEAGYESATPIQKKAIPPILRGRDVVGCAQTGTGKTAAFALPTLQRLMESADQTGAARRRKRSGRRVIRALILAPTRELAGQIRDCLTVYAKFSGLRHAVVFGGVRQGPQVTSLQSGIDILVATPGRLLDLIGQGFVKLAAVELLILDEADMMLDMGFLRDLRKIVAQIPADRQTLLFSATMPPEIRKLAGEWLRRPAEVSVTPIASTPALVSQTVYFVDPLKKAAALASFLRAHAQSKTLVFARTRRGADRIARRLEKDGIRAIAIHGDKSQNKRRAVLEQFNSERPPVLVATDLAARGLDFSDISHVVNYDLPDAPETYVHRIGRTARAGAGGSAVTFCGREEMRGLRLIEKLTGKKLAVGTLPTDAPTASATASEDQALPLPSAADAKSTATAGERRAQPRAARKSGRTTRKSRTAASSKTGRKKSPKKSTDPAPGGTGTKPAQPRRKRTRRAENKP